MLKSKKSGMIGIKVTSNEELKIYNLEKNSEIYSFDVKCEELKLDYLIDSVYDNSNGLININTASETELDTLPGIGPVTAQKIINAMPFAAIEDLESNKIVSSKVYLEIKDKITAQ